MKLKKIYIVFSYTALFFAGLIEVQPLSGQDAGPANYQAIARSGYQDSKTYHLSTNPDLEEYILAAVHNNPDIKATYARWQTEISRIAVAKGLPNPNLNFGYFLKTVETAVGPQEFKIGVMQMIPWFGKLRLDGKLQTLRAEIQLEYLQAKINNLVYNLSVVYYDYYFLTRSLDILDQNIDLVSNWEQVVRRKYTTAQSSHPDLIKTQIEIIKLEDDRQTLITKKLPLLERFRSLINDSTLTAIVLPDSLMNQDISQSKENIISVIFDNNPNYRVAELKKDLGNIGVDRARLSYYPDLGIGFDYIGTGEKTVSGSPVINSGKDPLVLMFSLKIPIWFKKNKARVEAAKYQRRSAVESIVNIENLLTVELEQAWFELDDAQRKINLYINRLIPKSVESLRATEKAYIAGKLDFLNLIDAQRRYLQFLLEYERSLVQYQKAYARLENLAGSEL